MDRPHSQTLSSHFASLYYQFFTPSRHRRHHQQPLLSLISLKLSVLTLPFSLKSLVARIESCPSGVFSLQIQNSNNPGFFKVLDSSTTQLDGSTATQLDGSTATEANGATAPQEVAAATQAEATDVLNQQSSSSVSASTSTKFGSSSSKRPIISVED